MYIHTCLLLHYPVKYMIQLRNKFPILYYIDLIIHAIKNIVFYDNKYKYKYIGVVYNYCTYPANRYGVYFNLRLILFLLYTCLYVPFLQYTLWSAHILLKTIVN